MCYGHICQVKSRSHTLAYNLFSGKAVAQYAPEVATIQGDLIVWPGDNAKVAWHMRHFNQAPGTDCAVRISAMEGSMVSDAADHVCERP